MNHMTADKYGVEILKSNNKIQTATGIITYASGKTKPIKLGKSICSIELIVFIHQDHDFLLGHDWFLKTN